VVSEISEYLVEIFDPEDGILSLPVEKFDELWSYSNRAVIVVKKRE